VKQDEFDFEGPEEKHGIQPVNRAVRCEFQVQILAGSTTWNEVPQALFLSWSPAMQQSYCAARDRDSAAHAENDWWRNFYLGRADMYVDSL
jgi:hypothetical protein